MVDRKPGRPTESVKDNLLKVRVDLDTLTSLDEAAKVTNKTRSEIIREVLPTLSSKGFEDMISLNSLQILEKYSLQCREYFSEPNKKIRVSDVSLNFPAFITAITTASPTLFIKFPTYMIRFLQRIDTIKEIINPIVKSIDGISEIRETRCFLFQKNQEVEDAYLPEVMLMKPSLEENVQLKKHFCSILDQNNLPYEVLPAYYLFSHPIKIEKENEIDYIVT